MFGIEGVVDVSPASVHNHIPAAWTPVEPVRVDDAAYEEKETNEHDYEAGFVKMFAGGNNGYEGSSESGHAWKHGLIKCLLPADLKFMRYVLARDIGHCVDSEDRLRNPQISIAATGEMSVKVR